MIADDEVSMTARGDRNRDGRRKTALAPAPIEHLADGSDVYGVSLQYFDQRLFELGSTDLIQQKEQARGGSADVITTLGGQPQECWAARRGLGQAIEAAMLPRATFLSKEALQVLRLLELLIAVPAALVNRQHLVALDDADGVEVRQDDERAPRAVVRDGVVVEVEANVRRLAHLHLDTLVCRKRVSRQRQELTALVLKGIPDRARTVFDPRSLARAGIRPLARLLIEVGEVRELPGREEGVPNVADGSLDATFLVAASHGHRPRLEAIVSRQLEQQGIESNGVALPLEHGALEIVVEDDARHATELGEGLDVTADEERRRSAGEEAEDQSARE